VGKNIYSYLGMASLAGIAISLLWFLLTGTATPFFAPSVSLFSLLGFIAAISSDHSAGRKLSEAVPILAFGAFFLWLSLKGAS